MRQAESDQGTLWRSPPLWPGYLFLSSHYHLLLYVDNAPQLSRFMTHANSNLAREISRIT
jgi:hypothetical protein